MTYRRVTVLGPRSMVDVALPADVAVAELAPMLLELLGEPPSPAPVPWRLDGIAGAPLPPAATLAQLGVLDGELLRLGPALPPPSPPTFDDAPEAVAAAVAGRAGDPDATPAVAGALAVGMLSAGLAGLRGDGAWGTAAAVLEVAVAAGLVVGVARAAGAHDLGSTAGAAGGGPDHGGGGGREQAGGRTARTAWALAALPPAAAAGWLALPGPTAVGLPGAAVGAALAAFAAQAALRIVAPSVLAALLVSLTSAFGLVAAVLTGAGAAAVGTTGALAAILAAPLAPRCALRLAGLRPGEDPPETATAQARGHLAGLVVAVAVVAAGGAVLAASAPGPWGPAFAVLTCLVLGLRSRGFAEPLPARAQLVAALVGAAALTVVAPVSPMVRLVLGAVGLGALLGCATLSRPPLGPVGRRTVDLAELAATALCVPLAVAALDLFALVRGW
ncbi:type VII secretion integral membrane protein EccD [Pseudonocardia xishanensis]|uniref:EccD-like transmembrane domain-containing protein n=1 Tax=Pseudonocardia xishanensis TaxID=630995 RepID=A0ABP8RT25_9PSEU